MDKVRHFAPERCLFKPSRLPLTRGGIKIPGKSNPFVVLLRRLFLPVVLPGSDGHVECSFSI